MLLKCFFGMVVLTSSLFMQAQCLQWIGPDPNSGYNVFTDAPCSGETETFQLFQVIKSEAYQLPNVEQGSEYSFGICGEALSWLPDFTILSPSGVVDAFGSDASANCRITFTASESGTYLAVVNEINNCGVQDQNLNGYPSFTTISASTDCNPQPILLPGAISFEDGQLPLCWTVLDEDGDGLSWNLLQGEDAAFDGDWLISSQSYGDSAFTPDNYLISPRINIQSVDSLYYIVSAVNPTFPAEHYGVYVSTTGTDVDDFTDLVFSETLTTSYYQGRSIDFSGYIGEEIYIAFRHFDVNGQDRIALDAIALPGEVNCSLSSGLGASFNKDTWRAYPNPSDGTINLIHSGKNMAGILRIFSLNGLLVYSTQISLTSEVIRLDLNHLAPGMYFAHITTDTSSETLKLEIY